MFKQLLNEAILDLAIRPAGPILIKSGESGGLDPTHPDMEFIRMINQVFIPGSSLKGVVRAHAERIVRSLQPGQPPRDGRGACDPLKRGDSCGDRLERDRLESHRKYARSCAACRLFGSTIVASRARFADALPQANVAEQDRLVIEERNGVAIDRVYGAVGAGRPPRCTTPRAATTWPRATRAAPAAMAWRFAGGKSRGARTSGATICWCWRWRSRICPASRGCRPMGRPGARRQPQCASSTRLLRQACRMSHSMRLPSSPRTDRSSLSH